MSSFPPNLPFFLPFVFPDSSSVENYVRTPGANSVVARASDNPRLAIQTKTNDLCVVKREETRRAQRRNGNKS